ncbi:MAG: sigma-70 family RNA polymerase sigma factor [Chloroflexota bacterium]
MPPQIYRFSQSTHSVPCSTAFRSQQTNEGKPLNREPFVQTDELLGETLVNEHAEVETRYLDVEEILDDEQPFDDNLSDENISVEEILDSDVLGDDQIVEFEPDEEMEEDIHQARTATMESLLEEVTTDKSSPVDSVRLYLNEIGLHPLLTGAQEAELAQRIAKGKAAFEELNDENTNLTPSEVHLLEQAVEQAEMARRQLAQSNLRLVVSIAKRYTGRGLTLLDLIQEGSMGLMRAVDKFDYTLGYKFSTYATWWIRQALNRGLSDKARTIRIPVHVTETLYRQSKITRSLEQELGREPTDQEIALEMELLTDDDATLVRTSIQTGEELPDDVASRLARVLKKVGEIKRLKREPISLQQPIGKEDSSELADILEDDEAPDPIELASRQMLHEQIHQVLADLNERERTVLIKRFGLDNGESRTLEDVGKELDVTRERVRQIEAKALRKLRHPVRSRSLSAYME